MTDEQAGNGTSGPTDVVRRYYELVDAGDIAGLLSLFDDSVIYYRPGYEPLIGPRQLRKFYEDVRVIRAGVHTLSSVIAAGRQVAVMGEFAGTLKDDRAVTLRFADHFVLNENDLVVRRETFFAAPLV